MGTQEFYANVDLKGNQLKNVVVDVVTELPSTATATAGRIVSNGGKFYVGNGTKWVEMADADVVSDLSGTVSGHTTKIEKLEEAVGTDESGNTLTARVTTLEGTVGDSTKGLVKKVNDNATSIESNATDITNLTTRVIAVENKATTNTSGITTLEGRMDTAESDIDSLEEKVGGSMDSASATGSVYARVAKNVNDITGLTTRMSTAEGKITTLESGKVDKVDGKGLSTNDYTTDEKTKLGAIAEGAQVNVLEKVKFQGSGQTTASELSIGTDKSVTIDLSQYALKDNLANAYIYKGSVDKLSGLPTSGQTAGDVYNVNEEFTYDSKKYPAGTNVAWNGSAWDPLGGTVDLSSYATTSYVNTEVGKKQDNLTDAQKDAVNSGITSGKVSTYEGYAALITTAQSTADAAKATADKAVVANTAITGATKCKVTYDSKGLVTGGADLAVSDIPSLPASKITSETFDVARIPVKLVSKTATLSTSGAVEVTSGLGTVYLAQVLYGGKVIFVDTTISGGIVTLGTASEALSVTVNMVGLSS